MKRVVTPVIYNRLAPLETVFDEAWRNWLAHMTGLARDL